ncbi:glutamate racemase [Halomonas saccharevitans]|uniref:Glutamate racemase n=1 Tax=Halomonas saccharevitans TaxID=416872 RepID=A0A1I6YVR4_9GAMM|nr:glutamate racemase [Halomonas saccharevitans]SFT54321.1 glutamate racemase [Halomonas saccharevitans]
MVAPILVFDSGVGGLSVVQALRHRLPGVALAYACDNAMLPYGRREDAWLVQRIRSVCQAAVAASGCRALVVACNTASTLALDALRECLTIPVIGTVPAIKPAASVSRTRHIGLLATTATVSRPYTLRLIQDFAADCRVTRLAADALVGEAERLVVGEVPDRVAIGRALAPLWEASAAEVPPLDTVVLGCTHFPLLRRWLAEAAPREVAWVDSGEAIARRVAQVVTAPDRCQAAGPSYATALDERLGKGLAAFGFAPPRWLQPG